MLKRCYNKNFQERKPTYKECIVCEEWHNYQNFKKWFDENYYEIPNEIMCLDKDILVKNNKLYSPQTCCFVPNKINTLFINKKSARGNLPIGVKTARNKTTQKYVAHTYYKDLGTFNTIEDAFKRYKKHKEDLIKQIANEYKNLIPQKL